MTIKDQFLRFCKTIIGDRVKTRFWKDIWLGDTSLAQEYPSLYNLTLSKNIIVGDVFNEGWDVITFRRTLWGKNLRSWNKLQEVCKEVKMNNDNDKLVWKLTTNKQFRVNSFYKTLKIYSLQFPFKFLWKAKNSFEGYKFYVVDA